MQPLNRIVFLAGLAATLGLASCASVPPGSQPAGSANELVASDVPDSGRMRGIVINRRYGDFFMVERKEVRREIELAWDYDRATAIRRTYDLEGTLLQTEDIPGAEMRLTPAEDKRLHALVRGYPALKKIAAPPDVVIWGGGFVMRKPNDRWCGPGSRCVRAMISADYGNTAVGHAVVDLQRDRVVYPFYNSVDDDGSGGKADIKVSTGSK